MKYRKRERCLACYGQIKYLNTLTRHLRTIHNLSRSEYHIKFNKSSDLQNSVHMEKYKDETEEIKGGSLGSLAKLSQRSLELNSGRKIIPLDVLAHDKHNERIYVQYSDGDVIWVPTSMLLRDDELRARFTFFHACEKTETESYHSY